VRYLYELTLEHPELEALTNHLSITTMRYVPPEFRASVGSKATEDYLNRLSQALLSEPLESGLADGYRK
jgi:hypothetical protein